MNMNLCTRVYIDGGQYFLVCEGCRRAALMRVYTHASNSAVPLNKIKPNTTLIIILQISQYATPSQSIKLCTRVCLSVFLLG